MDDKFAMADKKVLVELVKLSQRRGMQGSQGTWKEFLKIYDKKLGTSISDPARRTREALHSFISTFTEENDQNFFAKVLKWHQNRDVVEQFRKGSSENESPEQGLVRLTLEHPQYVSDYSFPSFEEGWLITKPSKKTKTMLAIDCEMVLCEDGTEAVVKVCVVDCDLKEVLNELVNPSKEVADYRTSITGVSATDFDGISCSLSDIQKSLRKLLSHGTILIGHSLHNDLKGLKIDHATVIDTSYIFKYPGGTILRRPSLVNLCKCVLGYDLRKEGTPHNPLDDSRAAMKLVLARLEGGIDDMILSAPDTVLKAETERLYVHRIPPNLTSEELTKFIPGDFTIEVKTAKKPQASTYGAAVIFKTPYEADHAYDNLEGTSYEDSNGLPQKLLTVQLKTGDDAVICVRKMTPIDSSVLASVVRKRELENNCSDESKRQKVEQKDKLMKNLKNEVKELKKKKKKKK